MRSANHIEAAPQYRQPFNWRYAIYAGFLAAAVFLFVSRGIPYSSGLMSPTVVGREVHPPVILDGGSSMTALILHMLASIIYALLVAPLVTRMRPFWAVLTGGALGVVLYGINYVLFSMLFADVPGQRESIALVTHVAFGMVAAAAYKGMVDGQAQMNLRSEREPAL